MKFPLASLAVRRGTSFDAGHAFRMSVERLNTPWASLSSVNLVALKALVFAAPCHIMLNERSFQVKPAENE